MEKSKTIEILKTLTPEEIKKFKYYLSSPLFNTNNNVISLFDALKKYYPDFKPSGIKKEKIYNKIFGGKQYNEQIMKNLISEFLKLQRGFFSYLHFDSQPFHKEINTLRIYEKKNLDKMFESGMKKFKKQLTTKTSVDDSYFRKLFLTANLEKDFYLNRDRQTEVPPKIIEMGELMIIDMLDKMSIVIRDLIVNEDTLNAKFDFNIPYQFWDNANLDKLMEYMKDGSHKYYTMAAISYLSAIAYRDIDDDEPYDKLKKLIMENHLMYDHNAQLALFGILEQACIRKTIYGRPEVNKELFNIYKLILEKKVHRKKGVPFLFSRYRNICITALNVKEYDWAEEFLNKYRNETAKEAKDNMYYLLSAQVNFVKKKFEKSLDFLSKVKDDSFRAKYDIKELQLKLYYELGYFEAGFSLVASIRHYLSKNKLINESKKIKAQNYVNSMNSLLKLKAQYSEEGMTRLKASLKNLTAASLANYQYILVKAKHLEERK